MIASVQSLPIEAPDTDSPVSDEAIELVAALLFGALEQQDAVREVAK